MSSFQNLSSVQLTELARLVDLEACWENLRGDHPITPGKASSLKELQQKQKAYEAFYAKLVAYNKKYKPAHVPELLLNNAIRLGTWCRRMRDLHLLVPQDSQGLLPSHLLEKAYRWADRVAGKLQKEVLIRPTLASTLPAAVRELEELAQWCEALAPAKLAG